MKINEMPINDLKKQAFSVHAIRISLEKVHKEILEAQADGVVIPEQEVAGLVQTKTYLSDQNRAIEAELEQRRKISESHTSQYLAVIHTNKARKASLQRKIAKGLNDTFERRKKAETAGIPKEKIAELIPDFDMEKFKRELESIDENSAAWSIFHHEGRLELLPDPAASSQVA